MTQNNSNQHNDGRLGGRGRSGGRYRGGRGSEHRGRSDGTRGTALDDTIEELGIKTDKSMCIAIEGCCHGELDAIYDRIRRHEDATGSKVDLLLCCGDFQSLRNTADYRSLAVPPKYRSMGSFYKYYSGEKETPVLTIFIGGNHEASQPLQELYYGGWVAPKIYYLGAAGVVNVGGVRIGGVSGIYKSHDFTQGRFERPPYDNSTMRSVYHVRNIDIFRMKCLSQGPDIMMSHDWPQGIEQFGNTKELLRRKPFFRDEVERNDLGSPCNRELLDTLKPKWWFSAHLHVKFMATVRHNPEHLTTTTVASALVPSQLVPIIKPALPTKKDEPEQKLFSKNEVNENTKTTVEATQFYAIESTDKCNSDDLTDQMTRFLSLDKCLPRRQFLSILHITSTKPKDVMEYDLEWLAILQKSHELTVIEHRRVNMPNELIKISQGDLEAIRSQLGNRGLSIPNNFCVTVPPHDLRDRFLPPIPFMGNPQSDELLNLLALRHIVTVPFENDVPLVDDNEIDLDDGDDDDEINLPAGHEAHMGNCETHLDDDEKEIDVDKSVMNEKTLKKPRLDGI